MPHDACHTDDDFDGINPAYRCALMAVIALNSALLVVELKAGQLAGSRALQADALDFGSDALTYGISPWAIGRPLRVRARVAQVKAGSLALMGLTVLGLAIGDALAPGVPEAQVMGLVGFLALAANVASVLILMRRRDGD